MTSRSENAGAGTLVLLLIGAAFFCGGLYIYLEQSRVQSFPPVEGTVVEASIDEVDDDDSGTNYYPVVVWRYEVDGQAFGAGRLAVVSQGGDLSWARGVLEQYPVGADVVGRYDPEDPSHAYILSDVQFFGPLFAAVGALFLVWAVAMFRRWLRR